MIPLAPPRLALAQIPTPLVLLERLSRELNGPRIWLKSDDLTGALASGNKIRKLEFLLAEALEQGCSTVITCGGLQSNHCRATAAMAARLGLSCELILRGPRTLEERPEPYELRDVYEDGLEGNLLLDHLCGAKTHIYSPRFYAQNLNALLLEHIQQAEFSPTEKCYGIPTGGSNSLGLWGYISAAKELHEDCTQKGFVPDAVVCASGSGGTQGGLTLGFHLLGETLPVVGMAVCDSSEYFSNKIQEDVKGWQARFYPSAQTLYQDINILTLDNYIGPGYAQGYEALFECIRWVAAKEGVVLDPVYTGKAFYGMVEEIKAGRFAKMQDIVFVHTGGIYGVFPFKHQLF